VTRASVVLIAISTAVQGLDELIAMNLHQKAVPYLPLYYLRSWKWGLGYAYIERFITPRISRSLLDSLLSTNKHKIDFSIALNLFREKI
jgi:hypothetical protein